MFVCCGFGAVVLVDVVLGRWLFDLDLFVRFENMGFLFHHRKICCFRGWIFLLFLICYWCAHVWFFFFACCCIFRFVRVF